MFHVSSGVRGAFKFDLVCPLYAASSLSPHLIRVRVLGLSFGVLKRWGANVLYL